MRNPLIVSDLDGTLFTSQRQLSALSTDVIGSFIRSGGLFTVATARMPYGCADRLASLNLQLPAIVMNGAALYSFRDAAYGHVFPIDAGSVDRARDVVARHELSAFIYTVVDGALRIAYTDDAALGWTQYNSQAAHDAGTVFEEVGIDDWSALENVIYIAVVGADARLAEAAAYARDDVTLSVISYRNIYTATDCLEIASALAGKDNALDVLLREVDCDAVAVFGDNHNDLALMKKATISFAPANSVPEALEAADVIVESNDEDGVAREIRRRFLTLSNPIGSAD